MRRHTFSPLHALVVIILLLSLVPPATMAQSECPPPLVKDPSQDICIDPETGMYVAPEDYPTEVPPPPTEDPVGTTPEPPAGNLASFTIYHLACNDDFDPNGVRDGGGLGSSNGCLTYGTPPFTYTISANGTAVITSTVEAVERDFARFDVPGPIPAGSLTMSVAPVTDYTTEFISCGLSIGDGPTDVIEPPIAGGAATLSTLPNQDVECWVYNVTRAPADTTITGGGGSVNMSFLSVSCPAGTVISADLDRICTDGLANVTYEILSETETLARNATDGNGVLIFENVPDGQLAIVQSAPAGYGKPYVTCTHYSPTTGDREYAPTIEYGTGFMASVAPGDDLNCTWFNFPAAGPDNGPSIMIQTRWCEGYVNGFAADTTLSEAEAACPPFSAREAFQVSLDGQAVASDQSNDVNGQVTFTKLPVSESDGLYGIELLARQDAQTVTVYCDKGTGDGIYAVVPSPLTGSNRIDQQLAAGETLRCSWFINYPYGPTGTVASDPPVQEVEPGIILVARLCSPGADLTQSDVDAACPTAGSGIAFDVAMAGDPYLNTTTDAEGVIDVPLPAGDATFTITPQIPAGYGLPGYLCVSIQTGSGGGGKVVSLTADAPSHDFTWSSNSETTCTYYFPVIAEEDAAVDPGEEEDGEAIQGVVAEQDESLAETQDDQASPDANAEQDDAENQAAGEVELGLTLQALQCPPEVAGSDAVLDEICTEPVSGLTFEILVDDVTVGTSVTDDAGNLAIPADAGPGMYQFRHQPSPDYLEMRTACSSVYPNGSTASGSSSASGSQMGQIYLSYDAASRVTCIFYFVLDPAATQTGDSPVQSEDQITEGESNAADSGTATSHSLTLQFWTCPEGVDLTAGPDVLEQACSMETAERSFLLTVDGLSTGETITAATTWEFQTSPVYADIGAGLISSAWCESSWAGGNEGAAETQDDVSLENGALTVSVTNPATTVTCDWFISPT